MTRGLRAGWCSRSSRCGSSPRSSSSSSTCCPTTSAGRSSARSRRRRASTRSTSELGTDRPLIRQYLTSIAGVFTLRLRGFVLRTSPPVSQHLPGPGRSAKLAALALVITIPISIAGRALCRAPSGQDGRSRRSSTRLGHVVDPRFVTGAVLVVVVRRAARAGSGARHATATARAAIELRYLLMPALAMAVVYFGYIARMTRAGTIDVLQPTTPGPQR